MRGSSTQYLEHCHSVALMGVICNASSQLSNPPRLRASVKGGKVAALRAVAAADERIGGVRMKLTVQLVIEPGDGSTVVTEVTTLEREELTDETLGLTLAESKTILACVQEAMVAQQAASVCAPVTGDASTGDG